MHPYCQIFLNSLEAAFALAVHGETGWFAAWAFGNYDMRLATAAALAGSVIGMGANYAIGYYVSGKRTQWARFNEKSYERLCKICRRYFVLLLLYPAVPLAGIIALIAGVFRVPAAIIMTVILLGRIGYYGYYLLHQ